MVFNQVRDTQISLKDFVSKIVRFLHIVYCGTRNYLIKYKGLILWKQ